MRTLCHFLAGFEAFILAATLGGCRTTASPSQSKFDSAECRVRWVNPPCNRWTYQNIDKILDVAEINPGTSTVHEFETATRDIGSLTFVGDKNKEMSVSEWLSTSFTDGFIALKNGKIVSEIYGNGMTPETRHHMFSVTKSITATVSAYLIHKHKISLNDKISKYMPELANSGFSDYTVQDLLNMNNHIAYNEDYENKDSDFYSLICTVTPSCPMKSRFPNIRTYLASLKGTTRGTDAFNYATPATDVLMWFNEVVSKEKFQDYFAEVIWSKLGAKSKALIIVDPKGTAFAGAGIAVTLRDAARFGQMMANKGYFNNQQILPPEVVATIEAGGDHSFFARSPDDLKILPKGSYNNMWWMSGNDHNAYMALGIYGQTIYIDPVANVVIVKQSSLPRANDDELYFNEIPAFDAIARNL